jgi:hypothetical protein
MEPVTDSPAGPAPDDGTIWIEILSRGHEVLARHRCTGPVVNIGRGYGNQVVIDDPHVAVHHLRITRGADGRLLAEDLESVNGLFIDGQSQALRQIELDSGTPLRIGHTRLRACTAGHDVAPERPLAHDGPLWALALTLVALQIGLGLLDSWFDEIDKPQLSHYVTPLLFFMAVALAWTGMWAVLSRIFTGKLYYARHLAIAFTAALAMHVHEHGSNLVAYALSWAALTRYTYVGTWLTLAALCFFHLRVISKRHPWLMTASVLLLAALGITGQTLSRNDSRAAMGSAVVVRKLQPPGLRLAQPHTREHFVASAAALKGALDRARSEEPPPTRADGFSFDDD